MELALKVYKVQVLIRRSGHTGLYVGDLIFRDGTPTVVIEWEDRPSGSTPSVVVALDPAYLHELDGPNVNYVYERPIEDPRRLD